MSIEVPFSIYTLRKKGRIPLVREKDERTSHFSFSDCIVNPT